jgi:diaminopimelate decarboxylase
MTIREIAGVPIPSLVRQFGTPTYVYDRATIEARIRDLAAFPVIRYSQKANSNLAILDIMRRNGVAVDAVSAGEIHRALKAGFRPDQICYTADVFDQAALAMVAQYPVAVNCGSADMIRQFGRRSPERAILLRVNPGFGHGHSRKTNTGGEQSKHGIWHEQLPDCLKLAKGVGLAVTGIHMHIGSGTDLEHLAQVCSALETVARQVGPDLTTISAGGGLPIPYRPTEPRIDLATYARLWLTTKQRLEEHLGKPVTLEIEPGRYLVAECGYLLCEIRAIKQTATNTFYLLDAGFNNLARPVMYGAYHPMSVCPMSDPAGDGTIAVVVAGALCESGDVFTQAEGGIVETRELPKAQVGDILVIRCVGAYGFAMSSNYNSMPLAAEVLISHGAAHLVRKRQSFDDLTAGESIPEG